MDKFRPQGSVLSAAQQLVASMERAREMGWYSGAYMQSIELLKAMEDRLSSRKRIPLKRFSIVPIYLWLRGFEQIAISYGRGYVALFTLGFLGLLLSQFLPANLRPSAEIAAASLNLFAAFTLFFAAPSTYCSSGTNSKHVQTVTDKLYEWQIEAASQIELILKNTRIFEERVARRLVIFRWFLGVAWAIFYGPTLAGLFKDWSSFGVTFGKLAELFPPFALLIGVFVVVESYARGVDILFRCVEFGCNERIAEINRKQGK